METPDDPPASQPTIRGDWTCLASAVLIALMLCAVLIMGSIWLYTLSHHAM